MVSGASSRGWRGWEQDCFTILFSFLSGLGDKGTQLGLGSGDTWSGLGNKNPESQSYDATNLLICLFVYTVMVLKQQHQHGNTRSDHAEETRQMCHN